MVRIRGTRSGLRMPSSKPKTALTVGTAKGTCHMPGYQGFLPTNTANPRCAAIAHGENTRTTDKTNLTSTFHTNIVGYAGHKPTNAANDRGGVSLTTLTSKGRDFAPIPPEWREAP